MEKITLLKVQRKLVLGTSELQRRMCVKDEEPGLAWPGGTCCCCKRANLDQKNCGKEKATTRVSAPGGCKGGGEKERKTQPYN